MNASITTWPLAGEDTTTTLNAVLTTVHLNKSSADVDPDCCSPQLPLILGVGGSCLFVISVILVMCLCRCQRRKSRRNAGGSHHLPTISGGVPMSKLHISIFVCLFEFFFWVSQSCMYAGVTCYIIMMTKYVDVSTTKASPTCNSQRKNKKKTNLPLMLFHLFVLFAFLKMIKISPVCINHVCGDAGAVPQVIGNSGPSFGIDGMLQL